MTSDSARFNVVDMSRHETNISTAIFSAIFGALVPAAMIDTAGKIAIAFGCGFASLAGQALWRRVVRSLYVGKKL
jgi:hypothetical protein